MNQKYGKAYPDCWAAGIQQEGNNIPHSQQLSSQMFMRIGDAT